MIRNGASEPENAAAILHARALALARVEEQPDAQRRLELLEFRLARDRYAMETRHVLEVLPLGELTPVPCTPPFVAGVVNVRGRITAVIDLQKFSQLPPRGLTDLHHIILLRATDFEVGLLADAIVGIRHLAVEAFQGSLPALASMPNEYVQGITADRLVVLALERMLSDPRMIVHEEPGP